MAHRLFSSLPGSQSRPDVSPDGARIAFLEADNAPPEVWIGAADGSRPRRVRACTGACLGYDGVAWSPDGRWLLLLRFDGPVGEGDLPSGSTLELLDLATGRSRDVRSSAKGDLFSDLRWSPDGRSYCVTVASGDTGGGPTGSLIALGGLDGSTPRPLVPKTTLASNCDFAPDGRTVVYATSDLDQFPEPRTPSNLYTVAVSGSTPRALTGYGCPDGERCPITSSARAGQPRFTPTGTQLLFVRAAGLDPDDRSVELLDLATGRATPAVGDERPVAGQHPAPLPDRH